MSTKKYASAADRQRAHRQRVKERLAGLPTPFLASAPKMKKPTRPQRLAGAIDMVSALLDEYDSWLDAMPTNLAGTELAEQLQETVASLQAALDALESVAPPRGYGR